MATQHVGGSFAPPLTEEKFDAYADIINGLDPSPVKDAMNVLFKCCSEWWDLPESTGEAREHGSGIGSIVDLDEPVRVKLDEHIPWAHELDAMARLFDSIDPVRQKELRDAAHLLLWHVRELDLGREPITADKLAAK